MSERLPTCKEIVELVTEYLEGTMPLDVREKFEQHLVWCNRCRAYLEQMRETIRLTGKLSEESLSEETRAGLLDAFRGWSRR